MEKPIILRESTYTDTELQKFKETQEVNCVRDVYVLQLGEIFEVLYPSRKSSPRFEKEKEIYIHKRLKEEGGDWIYFPWLKTLLHNLSEKDYVRLTTSRNRNLITEEEQEKLRNTTVGIVGLSIGGNMATSIMYSGFSNTMKIADFDTLETTNLNRIRAGVLDVGRPKIEIISEQLYEINPYAELTLFNKGLDKNNLDSFVEATNIIFEAIDNFEMKILIRLAARKKKVPVVMFTNLGDSVLVDIERYDLYQTVPLFNGRAGDTPEEILEKKSFTKEEEQKIAVALVGKENIPPRAIASVMEVGKTLAGRPQLMSTVTIGSGFAAYITRKIVLGEHTESGRMLIKFDSIISNISK